MKISVIVVEKSLGYTDGHAVMLVQLQSSHFLHKLLTNALSLGNVVLGGNRNL